MIYGDPLKFAVMVEKLSCWTAGGSYDNGLFHYIIDGVIVPDKAGVATISGEIFCLSSENSLVSFPENSELFFLSKDEAFKFMLDSMLPGFLDCEQEVFIEGNEQRYKYQASTYNIEDNGFYVFSVSSGETVRILGAKVSELFQDVKGHGEWRDVRPINVCETFVSKQYVKCLVEEVVNEYGEMAVE